MKSGEKSRGMLHFSPAEILAGNLGHSGGQAGHPAGRRRGRGVWVGLVQQEHQDWGEVDGFDGECE